MPKADEKVMALVEKELEKNPNATVTELYEKAQAAHPSVGQLTHRQFNARYPLQVKRKKSQKKHKRKSRRRSTRASRSGEINGVQRDKIRAAFLDFATDLTSAEQRSELVSVLAEVDKYVDQVVKTVSK
ncbi:MAG: hypothetical protein ACOC5J_00140 [Gemmatimonadota bacterium]